MDCNNCNSCKCNQSGLQKLSKLHYKSSEGYYIYEDFEWVFIPFEKSFNIDKLNNILSILQNLNDNQKHDR